MSTLFVLKPRAHQRKDPLSIDRLPDNAWIGQSDWATNWFSAISWRSKQLGPLKELLRRTPAT
jgi:hypothetical protein